MAAISMVKIMHANVVLLCTCRSNSTWNQKVKNQIKDGFKLDKENNFPVGQIDSEYFAFSFYLNHAKLVYSCDSALF